MKNKDEQQSEVIPEHIEMQEGKHEFETSHQWRQYGNFIKCESCPFQHATHIGNNLLLCGVDASGKPLFKRIEISS